MYDVQYNAGSPRMKANTSFKACSELNHAVFPLSAPDPNLTYLIKSGIMNII